MSNITKRDIERYADEYEKGYDRENFEIKQVKYRRRMLIERIGFWKKKKGHALTVLEVGVGLEPLFQFIDDYNEWVCVEPAEDFAKNARKSAPENVKIIRGFIEESKTHIENKHFDIIIISGLLHEVEIPENILGVVKEVADEDTIIHVNVPNARSFHRILAMESGLIKSSEEFSERNQLFQQYHVFDKETLNELIRTACGKVHVEAQGTFFVKPFSHTQMAKLLEYEIIEERVLEGLYKMSEYIPEMGSEIYVEFRITEE